MKILFGFLLCILPVGGEISWDYYLYYKKKKEDNHTLTMLMRFALIALLCWINTTNVEFWRSALLALSFHLLFFPIGYNKIVIKKPALYLSPNVFYDKIEQWLRDKISTQGVIGFKAMILGSAIFFYLDIPIYPF